MPKRGVKIAIGEDPIDDYLTNRALKKQKESGIDIQPQYKVGDVYASELATKIKNLVPGNDETARDSFPGEKHAILKLRNGKAGMANYMGPGTNVLARLRRGDPPRTAADKVAMRHDIDYELAKNAKTKEEQIKKIREADERMVHELNKISKKGGDSMINIEQGRRLIQGKMMAEDAGYLDRGSFGGELNPHSEEDTNFLMKQRSKLAKTSVKDVSPEELRKVTRPDRPASEQFKPWYDEYGVEHAWYEQDPYAEGHDPFYGEKPDEQVGAPSPGTDTGGTGMSDVLSKLKDYLLGGGGGGGGGSGGGSGCTGGYCCCCGGKKIPDKPDGKPPDDKPPDNKPPDDDDDDPDTPRGPGGAGGPSDNPVLVPPPRPRGPPPGGGTPVTVTPFRPPGGSVNSNQFWRDLGNFLGIGAISTALTGGALAGSSVGGLGGLAGATKLIPLL